MTNPASGNEVFEMAMGMERIGKDFYEALAMASAHEGVREFCVRAARDELKHLETFRQMRDQWAKAAGASRVLTEPADALAALAKGRIQPDPAAARKVALHGTAKDAVALAIQMEQDAVTFYGELAARLPNQAQVLRGIVEVEKRHLADLQALHI